MAITFGTVVAPTITLASLASSTTYTGQQSTEVDYTSTPPMEFRVFGKFQVHTAAPTANTYIKIFWIPYTHTDIWADGYPDPFGASDATVSTASTESVMHSIGQLIWNQIVPATANAVYGFDCRIRGKSRGFAVEPRGILFVTQSTGQILSATAGNHVLKLQPIGY
jgi:hypothetical protein